MEIVDLFKASKVESQKKLDDFLEAHREWNRDKEEEYVERIIERLQSDLEMTKVTPNGEEFSEVLVDQALFPESSDFQNSFHGIEETCVLFDEE